MRLLLCAFVFVAAVDTAEACAIEWDDIEQGRLDIFLTPDALLHDPAQLASGEFHVVGEPATMWIYTPQTGRIQINVHRPAAVTAVPEPATLALTSLGLGIAAWRRRASRLRNVRGQSRQ
jgi:hypothetical protein